MQRKKLITNIYDNGGKRRNSQLKIKILLVEERKGKLCSYTLLKFSHVFQQLPTAVFLNQACQTMNNRLDKLCLAFINLYKSFQNMDPIRFMGVGEPTSFET